MEESFIIESETAEQTGEDCVNLTGWEDVIFLLQELLDQDEAILAREPAP